MKYTRKFKLLAYSSSFNRILFRSEKGNNFEKNIDICFIGCSNLSIKLMYANLEVMPTNDENLIVSTQDKNKQLFRLIEEGNNENYFIISDYLVITENTLDINTSPFNIESSNIPGYALLEKLD